jgi:hypothetical protein
MTRTRNPAGRPIFQARRFAADLLNGLLVNIGVLSSVEETAIDESY